MRLEITPPWLAGAFFVASGSGWVDTETGFSRLADIQLMIVPESFRPIERG
jgi:hypothetical protein